jgi:hypothetical protein
MKFRGKVISGSSLLLIMGVVFMASVVVVSAALATTLNAQNMRSAKSIPMSLTMTDGPGTDPYWDVNGDAWVNEVYDMKVTATTNWVGSYNLIVKVDAAEALTGSEVTMTYKAPGESTFTTIDLDGPASVHWTVTDGVLSFTLPAEEAIGTGYTADFEFTIVINSEINSVLVSFDAVEAVA